MINTLTTIVKSAAKVGKIPAKQARSQRTVERIELAARTLLQDQSWQNITMADLAKAAEANVGSIYARFEGKEALLDRLDEIYCLEIIEMTEALLVQMNASTLEEAISTFVDGTARYHHKNSGLVRTLILETRIGDHPSFHNRSKRMNATMQGVGTQIMSLAKAEGRALAPENIRWAVFFALSAVREAVLFPKGLPRPTTSFQKQIDEITSMVLGYLERI